VSDVKDSKDFVEELTDQSDDFSRWYTEVVRKAQLADYAPVRGCMAIRPYGYALWEHMQRLLDQRIKATGHQNAYFPMLIPESLLQLEADHVEGFAPECAWVTHGGSEKLEERLAIRPTSEAIIGRMYSRWIESYRDLPVLINQWNSVVRWELRTKLFLRTLEFWWQEGHTAHATYDEAEAETRQMLDVYTDFAVNEAAVPVIPGVKSQSEKFAGALHSYTIEAMMGDKRALQAGTSHNLGQNFAKAFNIQYLDRDNQLQHCWTTSWGLSTRFIGAIIMVHGDDQGLILPPRLAPYQVVIVPIYRSDAERATVLEAAGRVKTQLAAGGVRVRLDERDGVTPGFKFNDWEMRGVPLRVEIGPRDVEKRQVVLARRDMPGKAGKSFVPEEGLTGAVTTMLESIQKSMLERAQAFMRENTAEPRTYDEFKQAIEAGLFCRAWWSGDAEREAAIKDETKATIRCIPLEQPGGEGPCIGTGRPAKQVAIFGRAY
jgi:prolyl-tRNA synthetase